MGETIHVEQLPKCSKCGTQHNRFRDREKTGYASYCAGCHAEYMAAHRPSYSELGAEQKKAALARSYARVSQARGRISPRPCQVCGSENSQKHHPDYDQPLEVVWVCRSCHLAIHAGVVDCPQVLPPIVQPTLERRSRVEMRKMRERMKALESTGKSRKTIAHELGMTPAQVTRCLGAVRVWKDRRLLNN